MRIAVVVGAKLDKCEDAGEAPSVVAVVGAGGPGIDPDRVEVGEPPLAERRLKSRVGLARLLTLVELFERDWRLAFLNVLPRADDAVGERDDRLVRRTVRAVDQDDEGRAVDLLLVLAEELFFGRFVERNLDEPMSFR